MSRTTALGITPNRRPVDLAEFRNGHGWSPSIWSRLMKANHGYDGYLFADEGERLLDQLWQEIETLPEWQQIPLCLTFDTGVIPYEVYGEAADLMDEFDKRLPAPEGHVNHVPAMAELLRSGPEAPFFGVYGTSVSENPFDPVEYHDVDHKPAECDRWQGSDESGWCEGHGSGAPPSEWYVLPQHREIAASIIRASGPVSGTEETT